MPKRVTISVLTPIVNIGRWAGYRKRDEDIDLTDSYYGFTTTIEVECLIEEDWDDDMGRIAVPNREDLADQVWREVRATDDAAEYEIV